MYAVIECGGAQYKVAEKQKVMILRIDAKQGATVKLEKVLLVSNGKDVVIGTPVVKDAVVEATIVGHPRSAKIDAMRYTPKKDYRRRWGAHTNYTELLINKVSHPAVKPLAGEAPKPVKKVAKPKAEKSDKPEKTAHPAKPAKAADKGGKK
ncbi:MAG TPA: 50S ribosomal protein L21 [Candidatus Edwardsbacteria bacterium]|nr:50S ribosomal protein L21 [Candidatus Edwardsbacteria bacterium]